MCEHYDELKKRSEQMNKKEQVILRPELGEGAAAQDGYLVTWQAPKPKTNEETTKELKEIGIEPEKVEDEPVNYYPKDRNVV